MTPDIAYGQLLPLLIVFGAAIVSVLVEAFVPARHRYRAQLVLFLGGASPRRPRWPRVVTASATPSARASCRPRCSR